MFTPVSGKQNLSLRQTLIEALSERCETNFLDFKATIDLNTTRDKVEIARDIIAFANTDGGHLVFGVRDRTFDHIGLDESVKHLDTTTIYKAVDTYMRDVGVELSAAIYEISSEEFLAAEWTGKKRFGIIRVEQHPEFILSTNRGVYKDADGREVERFRTNGYLVRRGAQTIDASPAEVRRLLSGQRRATLPLPQDYKPLDSNLPDRQEVAVDFIGRKGELELLEKWFVTPRQRRWMLVGDGGKGKTAIAYEFAARLQDAAPKEYHCVIWISAKRRRYDERQVQGISSPDFSNLTSLLDALARGYGFSEYYDLPLEEKTEKVTQLLREFPAFIVVDDIDSLDIEDEDAVSFLIDVSNESNSKILLTSRRLPYGWGKTHSTIRGLGENDGIAFINSRVKILDLQPKIFNDRICHEILAVTDGSPLYIEDLLRFASVCPPIETAIDEWSKRSGDEAREYALKREYDYLKPDAKKMLLACCISDNPMSFEEIRLLTKLSKSVITSHLNDLHRLFLISKPQIVEGVEKFEVNLNTRSLVLHVYSDRDLVEQFRATYGSVILDQHKTLREDVAAIIRNTNAHIYNGNYMEAKAVVTAGLQRFPNEPDLIAQLGVVFSRTKQMADAREHFEEAHRMGCKQEWVYTHWARMEFKDLEWQNAIKAAQKGIRSCPQSARLHYFAGFAHSRRGQDLFHSMNPGRAQRDLQEAYRLFGTALTMHKQTNDTYLKDVQLSQEIYRGIVVNLDKLLRVIKSERREIAGDTRNTEENRAARMKALEKKINEHIKELHGYIDIWQQKYPKDVLALDEGESIRIRNPLPQILEQ